MGKTRLYKSIMILISLVAMMSCSENELIKITEADKGIQASSSSVYFPVDVGNYWIYNCQTTNTSATSTTNTMEYRIKLHVLSQLSDGSYQILIDSPLEKELIIVTQDDAGNLILDGHVMFSQNDDQLDPQSYQSILNCPKLAEGTWNSQCNIHPKLTTDTLYLEYEGTETRANETGGTDSYEHTLVEKYARHTGLTTLIYSQRATLKATHTHTSWSYELIESGQKIYTDIP